MYQINREKNRITKLEEKTFTELGLKERDHLQEWIAKDPSCLGEELLVIQKEFDGFQETKERLDLLALNKQGILVVIENKLDNSGKDVTWQVLKYASYCSSLSKDEIRSIFQKYLRSQGREDSAEDILSEFLEAEDYEEAQINQGTAQRIIMIAAKFRKEVTSTVLWLMNFALRIQCFKVTPFMLRDQLFLNFDQILPVKDTQDYAISMASKAQEEITTQENLKERHHKRIAFWTEFLKRSNAQNDLFSNISPSKDSWITSGIGMSGIGLQIVCTKKYGQVQISIHRGSKDENKGFFDHFYKRKEQIEKEFGSQLIWDRMDDNISSRIRAQKDGVSLYNKEDWDELIKYLIDTSGRMEKAFKNPIRQLSRKTKQA